LVLQRLLSDEKVAAGGMFIFCKAGKELCLFVPEINGKDRHEKAVRTPVRFVRIW
jgi:hypothetical protein